MKRLLDSLLVIVMFVCVGCSSDFLEEVLDYEIQNRASDDADYSVIGFGYDCVFSDFKGSRYVTFPIIDLEKFKSGIGKDAFTGASVSFPYQSIEVISLPGSTNSTTAFGLNVEEYSQDISSKIIVDINKENEEGKKLFTLNLTDFYQEERKFSDQNAYMRMTGEILTRKVTLSSTSPSTLCYFLTDDFIEDINRKSGKEIVQKYGTHVLTDIVLGGATSVYFNAKLTSTTLDTTFKNDATTFFREVTTTTNITNIQNCFSKFHDILIKISTIGGKDPITLGISYDPVQHQLGNFNFSYDNWMKSVSEDTEQLIGIGRATTKIYRISEFITNSAKKAEVEKALQEYIDENSIKVIKNVSFDYENVTLSTFSKSTGNREYRNFLVSGSNNKDDYEVQYDTNSARGGTWCFLPYGDNIYRLKASHKEYCLSTSANKLSVLDETSIDQLIVLEKVGKDYMMRNYKSGLYFSSDKQWKARNLSDKTQLWRISTASSGGRNP